MSGVYVVTVEARQRQFNATAGFPDGAVINVYSTVTSEPEARAVAAREIAAAGWQLVSIDSVSWWAAENFGDCAPAGREYLEQAIIDGTVLVVHHFPQEPFQ